MFHSAVGRDTISFGVDGGFIKALARTATSSGRRTTDHGFDAAVLTPDGSLYATARDRVFRYRTP
jgi:hypothetical protein